MLALGALLGPGYFIYLTFFTGQVIHSIALAPALGGFQPVSFSVEPKSDPIRIVLQVTAEHGPTVQTTPPKLRYVATVAQQDSQPVSYPVEFNALLATESELREFSEAIATFPVPKAATYTVSIRETGLSQMGAIKAMLQVRERVSSPARGVVWVGVVLLAAGILLLLVA